MKTDKKKQPAPAEKKIALTPRQVALHKLYRFLAIIGIVAGIVTLSVLVAFYGHLLRPDARKRLPTADDEMREPKLNADTAPGAAPEGMVWVRGGEFYMGNEELEEALPIQLIYVDGFWMDKYEVTNEQFAKFVAATGFVTEAERQPDPRDFPRDVDPQKLKPFSGVFKKLNPGDPYDLRSHHGWWDIKYGASWKHPEGPSSSIKGRENHPVVHICYEDAIAYCQWAKKRLPTEAEWEFAARGGLDRKQFPWGDELTPDGKWMANIWQGNFPVANALEDGFEATAPVGSYSANGYGLHDMAGNVWEWCSDWYWPGYDRRTSRKNPVGPDSGWDPNEDNTPKRVQRGGSFLCAANYCERYIVGSRGKGEIKSALNHTGFRCVLDSLEAKHEPEGYVPWLLGIAAFVCVLALVSVWWLSRKHGEVPT